MPLIFNNFCKNEYGYNDTCNDTDNSGNHRDHTDNLKAVFSARGFEDHCGFIVLPFEKAFWDISCEDRNIIFERLPVPFVHQVLPENVGIKFKDGQFVASPVKETEDYWDFGVGGYSKEMEIVDFCAEHKIPYIMLLIEKRGHVSTNIITMELA